MLDAVYGWKMGFRIKYSRHDRFNSASLHFWVRQMATDPFEKFERSRVGWTIPLALFIIGGGLTYFAVSSLHGVLLRELESAQAEQAARGGDVQTANPVVELDNGESDEIGSDVGVTGAPEEK